MGKIQNQVNIICGKIFEVFHILRIQNQANIVFSKRENKKYTRFSHELIFSPDQFLILEKIKPLYVEQLVTTEIHADLIMNCRGKSRVRIKYFK